MPARTQKPDLEVFKRCCRLLELRRRLFLAAEWKSPAGRRIVAVVNVAETPRRFEAGGVSLDLAPLEVRIVDL